MKSHRFREGENLDDIARANGFRLAETIWNDPSNGALRGLRKSPYALEPGDVLRIPDLEVRVEDAETARRHVFRLVRRARPAYYSRLESPLSTTPATIMPVFAATGSHRVDVSFVPQIAGALVHVARTSPSLRFRALIAARGVCAERAMAGSCARFLRGERAAWLADALSRHDSRDIQTLLTWAANVRGLPTDPGAIDGSFGPMSREALRHFRVATDIDAGERQLTPDHQPRPEEDLGALFDLLERHLSETPGLGVEGLLEARARISMASPDWIDFTRFDPILGSSAPGSGLDLVLFDEQAYQGVASELARELGRPGAFYFLPVLPQVQLDTPEPLVADFLDIEDVHFGVDRYVLLPTELQDPPAGDSWGLGGIDVLVAALLHAQRHPNRQMLVAGHTDTTHDKNTNLRLSVKRANGVYFALGGYAFASEWITHAREGGTHDDVREILRWIDRRFRYTCRPSDRDKPNPVEDALALDAFHRQFNEDVDLYANEGNPYAPAYAKKVTEGPLVTNDTWRAFFDLYQWYLASRLGMSMTDLGVLQFNMGTMKPPVVGCGEHQTRDLNARLLRRVAGYPDLSEPPNAGDRRVEIIFFDYDEAQAVLDFPCHPTSDVTACRPELCVLYDQAFWQFRRIALEPEKMGTIALVRRVVRRADFEAGTFEEQPGGSFTPFLGESGALDFDINVPYVPFKGSIEATLARRTSQGAYHPVTTLQMAFKADDQDTVSVRLVWDGTVKYSVPRHLSDRHVFDENQSAVVFAPCREMRPGEPARFGAFVLQRARLLDKDGAVAGNLKPDAALQNEAALVVVPLIEIIMERNLARGLLDCGFGDDLSFIPFLKLFRESVFERIYRAFADLGIRFVDTVSGDKRRTQGMPVFIKSEQSATTPDNSPGVTVVTMSGPAYRCSNNLFFWTDRAEGSQCFSNMHFSTLMVKNSPVAPVGDRALFQEIFAPLGVAANSYWYVPGPTSDDLMGNADVVLEVKVCAPRSQSEDGTVTGRATEVDANNCNTSTDSAGLAVIQSSDGARVPPLRAAQLQRALRAAVGYTVTGVAHELGHYVGAVSSLSKNTWIDVDGTRVQSPHAQGAGDHDPTASVDGLMQSGFDITLAQAIGETSHPLQFNARQRDYLHAMFPLAGAFDRTPGNGTS